MNNLRKLIELLAHKKGVSLNPDWFSAGIEESASLSVSCLVRLTNALGWEDPKFLGMSPREHEFPLLVFSLDHGWAIADQRMSDVALQVTTVTGPAIWDYDNENLQFFKLRFPKSIAPREIERTIDLFISAFFSRPRMLLEAALATVVISLIGLSVSLYTMQIYDRVIPRAGYSTLWVLTSGVFIAVVLDLSLRSARAQMLEAEAANIDSEISEYFISKLLASRLDARPASIGGVVAQFRGLEIIRSAISSASLFLIVDLPFALFFIWVIYTLGGPVALVPFLAFPIALAMGFGFAWAIKNETAKVNAGTQQKTGFLVEMLDAAETLKASRGRWLGLSRWNALFSKVNVHDESVKIWSARAQSCAYGLQQIAYVLLIVVGAIEVINGRMTTGGLIACSIISGRINGPLVGQFPQMIVQWSFARSALAGLDQILQLPLDRPPSQTILRPQNIATDIQINLLTYAYPGARNGLDISHLVVRPGEHIAILGPVGSGKSTLMKLMAGLYQPQSGSIMIGGMEMRLVAEDLLWTKLGYMAQDSRLMNGTLRENLVLGLPDPGDGAIMEAAQETGLHQIISSHPQGLGLAITEGGRGLSTGQRTLVAATRLLLAKPKVWLLDEPAAALDNDSEIRLMTAINKAAGRDGTLVLVTHKHSLLQHVQRVILLIGGKIVLDGPRDEVLAKLRPVSAVAAN